MLHELQDGAVLTEDLIEETEELVLRTGRLVFSKRLFSRMKVFALRVIVTHNLKIIKSIRVLYTSYCILLIAHILFEGRRRPMCCTLCF